MRNFIVITFVLSILVGCSKAEVTPEERLKNLITENTALKIKSAKLTQQLTALNQVATGENSTALIELEAQLANITSMNSMNKDELLEQYRPEFREALLGELTRSSKSNQLTWNVLLVLVILLTPIACFYLWTLRYKKELAVYQLNKDQEFRSYSAQQKQDLDDIEKTKNEIESTITYYTSMKTRQEQELVIRAEFGSKLKGLIDLYD